MSRIAVISDIHANVPALEAVVRDLSDARVDEVLVNGDLVGRGPQGAAVVARVRELGWRCTRGNHEDYALQFRRGEVPQEWLTAPEWACARWIAEEIGEDHAEFLDRLPFTLASEREPELRLFHGSPRSHSEGIGRWTPDEVLREHLASIDEAVLVVAHTHRAMEWRLDERHIVNVGSVGLPFNGDTRAQYVVFDGHGTHFDAEFRRVPYDIGEVHRIYDESGFLEAGNATSLLLKVELETARPHLVPFLRWCECLGHPPGLESVDEFRSIYDPEGSMEEFARRFGLQ